jgi:hypothetical protein
MTCTLLGADGRPHRSDVKGQWGGHRITKIYGRAVSVEPRVRSGERREN